jgi:hypothetical protein
MKQFRKKFKGPSQRLKLPAPACPPDGMIRRKKRGATRKKYLIIRDGPGIVSNSD